MFCFNLLKLVYVTVWPLPVIKNQVTTITTYYVKHYVLIIIHNNKKYDVLLCTQKIDVFTFIPNQIYVFISLIHFSDVNVALNDSASTIDTS